MKYLDEYRDPDSVKKIIEKIHKITSRPWVIMEVCGGQTHSLIKFGIDQLLPKKIELLHGPGCPVCVTPTGIIDQALALSKLDQVIFCSFGDMLRVPGSDYKDLFSIKAKGGDVRIVYSPLDAVKIAQQNPTKEVVFLAVGFETTAPANALSVFQAYQMGLKNYSILVSHVLVPPAMEVILQAPENRVQSFLAAGHVCTVVGYAEYEPLAKKYKVPIVVSGFEPLDLVEGLYYCIKQLEEGRADVENAYARSVKREGNLPAVKLIAEIFEVSDKEWRGLGLIPLSGLKLKEKYANFDANLKFPNLQLPVNQKDNCISGLILTGSKKPYECPYFGKKCTPDNPLGATMVSSEGACSAYYRYRRYEQETQI